MRKKDLKELEGTDTSVGKIAQWFIKPLVKFLMQDSELTVHQALGLIFGAGWRSVETYKAMALVDLMGTKIRREGNVIENVTKKKEATIPRYTRIYVRLDKRTPNEVEIEFEDNEKTYRRYIVPTTRYLNEIRKDLKPDAHIA